MAIDPACWQSDRCQLASAQLTLEMARDLMARVEAMKEATMSAVLWCDPGAHAFSAKEKGRKSLQVDGFDEETGEPVREHVDVCAEHLATALFRPAPAPGRADPVRIAQLEREVGIDPQA